MGKYDYDHIFINLKHVLENEMTFPLKYHKEARGQLCSPAFQSSSLDIYLLQYHKRLQNLQHCRLLEVIMINLIQDALGYVWKGQE